MIQIAEHAEGCIIAVRAQPGARRNAVVGEQGEALKLAVIAPADQGKANDALAELLADTFGVKKSRVDLISGATSRAKRFLIRGISTNELRQQLASIGSK